MNTKYIFKIFQVAIRLVSANNLHILEFTLTEKPHVIHMWKPIITHGKISTCDPHVPHLLLCCNMWWHVVFIWSHVKKYMDTWSREKKCMDMWSRGKYMDTCDHMWKTWNSCGFSVRAWLLRIYSLLHWLSNKQDAMLNIVLIGNTHPKNARHLLKKPPYNTSRY